MKSKIRKHFMEEKAKNPNLIKYNLIKAKTIIYDIRNYFINFIKIQRSNLEFYQIGNDIVTVLVNLPEFSQNNQSLERTHVKYLKRIINYIMAKLNSWGLVYCPYPTFPFLLFSYAHINKFQEKETQKMNEKQKKYESLLNTKIEPQSYQCFNYKYLYNTFITNETQSKTLKKYENFIKLQWKGKNLTIQEVHADFSYLVFNSHYLYIFYDTYFMYHIAALYYEMEKIFQKLLSQEIQEDSLFQPEDSKIQRKIDYPEYLNSLVFQIMHLEKKMNPKLEINEISVKLEEIKNVFTKSNIIFVNDKKPKECKIKETDLVNYKLLTDEIIRDMSMLFNGCYLKTNARVRRIFISDTTKVHFYATDDDDNNNYTNVNSEILKERAREENLESRNWELPNDTEMYESGKLSKNTEAESSGIPEMSEPEDHIKTDKYTEGVPINF